MATKSETKAERDAKIQETFDLFFGPTEDSNGTGRVVREIGGELHSVLVDADEAAKFERERQDEIKARLEHERKLDDLMQALND